MVLYTMKWNILPGMTDKYSGWAQSAVKRLLSVPGVVEFRAYRMIAGSHQVIVTYEFADMHSLASWQSNETTQKTMEDGNNYITDLVIDIMGPSPIVPAPIRP